MPVVYVDSAADGEGMNDLTKLKFQTQTLQSSMADMPMDHGDDQDQDPLDGQQPTNPYGNQTPAQDGQGGGKNTKPSGRAPPSSAPSDKAIEKPHIFI